MSADRFDAVVNLAKRRGFVFPSSEIYGGTRSAWDYGPLGVELKENIRRQWWKAIVQQRDDVVGLDSAVMLAREVWVASGHLEAFVDPLTECQFCHKRFRADHWRRSTRRERGPSAGGPRRNRLPQLRQQGRVHPAADVQRLDEDLPRPRGERGGAALPPAGDRARHLRQLPQRMTAARKKPPFGIAQVGKAFRNEITPGNFIFRTREFEQMELEYFVEPGTDEKWHEYWLEERWKWYVDLGHQRSNLRYYEHPKEKLAHYSKRTVDIEYRFQFGGTEFAELEGIANRTDFDLSTHTKHSGAELSLLRPNQGRALDAVRHRALGRV